MGHTDVDHRLVAIIDGPKDVGGEAKSVRSYDALILSSTALSLRLGKLGLLESCNVPEVLPIAEAQLSPALRAGIGAVAFDRDPVISFDQWHGEMLKVIGIIDANE